MQKKRRWMTEYEALRRLGCTGPHNLQAQLRRLGWVFGKTRQPGLPDESVSALLAAADEGLYTQRDPGTVLAISPEFVPVGVDIWPGCSRSIESIVRLVLLVACWQYKGEVWWSFAPFAPFPFTCASGSDELEDSSLTGAAHDYNLFDNPREQADLMALGKWHWYPETVLQLWNLRSAPERFLRGWPVSHPLVRGEMRLAFQQDQVPGYQRGEDSKDPQHLRARKDYKAREKAFWDLHTHGVAAALAREARGVAG